MDYKYIELERQIKSLMNKNFVISSTRSKSAEEISNGSNSLYIDTIQKYFVFKVNGLSESVIVDPLNKSLLNVQYINDVDVSKLIGGIREGYGINITEVSNGVYEVNVKENMFASKDELDVLTDEINDKFTEINNNVYSKTDCDDKFALKTLTYTKTECDDKYALK